MCPAYCISLTNFRKMDILSISGPRRLLGLLNIFAVSKNLTNLCDDEFKNSNLVT